MAWELIDNNNPHARSVAASLPPEGAAPALGRPGGGLDAAPRQELVKVYREGVLVLARDPVCPWDSREVLLVEQPTRFAELMAAHGVQPEREPCVLMINGLFYSRAEWPELWINPGDRGALMWLPAGGKGSRIIAGIIMIIVGVIMMYFGNAYGANMVMAGAAMLAGGLLMPKLNVPTPDSANALAAPSPTYNLQAQGNYARLNQAIPVIYGRMRSFPDFAAAPWAEFAGNEQYLYQLFVIGQGEYDIEAVQIEDQLLDAELGIDGIWRSESPFEDISWQIIQPGGTVSYFPTRVLLSDAVAQQELLTNVSIGPFKITDAEVNYIGVDLVAPKGLYYANDAGGLDAKAFTVQVYATKLKASGASWVVDGAEFLLGTVTHSAATTTPQRISARYKVPEGRYQVRELRTDAKDGSSRAAHDVHWVGLRGYVPGLQQYGNLTLLAMRAKATNQLSSQSSRKINVITTRKLPVWNPATGWSLPQATRSIVWALADVLRNDQYGAGVSDDTLPLAEWFALERDVLKSSQADGDAFDYIFDRAMPAWEAIAHISKAGRALTYQRGPSYVTVRDQYRAVPVALFNMRNIERGSFKMSFALTDENATDAVRVTYWDEQIWSYSSFDCVPPGVTANKPEEVMLPGVGRRAQAAKIGHHMARAKRHRKVYGSFKTELEGRLVKPGDIIAVSHDLPEWGQSAELLDFTGTGKASGNVLELSEPLEWTAGEEHYIALARRNNTLSGAWRVSAGAEAHLVVLQEPINDAALSLYTGDSAERTRVSFGPAERYAARCLVLPPLRMKGNAVEITFVEDSPEVYDETGAVAPDADTSMQLPLTVRPVVRNLFVAASGNSASPSLDLSWEASGNPSYYLVEISDNGQQYSRLAEPTSASCRIAVKNGPVWLRVAAVASIRGDWAEWSGNVANMMSRPANVTGLALKNPAAGQPAQFQDVEAVFTWQATARADAYRVEVWADGAERSEHLRTDPGFTYTDALNRADGGPRRSFELRVYALNSSSESAAAAVLAVSNPQMPATVVSGQQTSSASILLTVPFQSAADYAGTRFVISQDADANPATLLTAADVPNWAATVAVGAVGTWYFWAANYDQFGTTGLNWSPRGQVTVVETAVSAEEVAAQISDALNSVPQLDAIVDLTEFAEEAGAQIERIAASLTGGGNILPNSGLEVDASGWVLGYKQVPADPDGTLARDLAGADWHPAGTHTIGLHRPGVPIGVRDFYNINPLPVEPGKRYCIAGRLANHRTSAQLLLVWQDAAGVSFATEDSLPAISSAYQGGQSLAGFAETFGFFTAPPAARSALYVVRVHPTGGTDPYTWLAEPQFAQATAEQTRPAPWSASAAGIATAVKAVADANGANATAIQQTAARLADGGDIKSAIVQVQSQASATADSIAGKWSVTIDAGTKRMGLSAHNDGAVSDFRIVADQIVMESGNLFPDPYFSDLALWVADAGWEENDAGAVARLGSVPQAAAMWSGWVAGTHRRHLVTNPFRMAVSASDHVRLSIRAANGSNQTFYATLQAFNKAGTFLSQCDIAVDSGTANSIHHASPWPIPEGAYQFRLWLYNGAPGTEFSGVVDVSEIRIALAAGTSLFVDGSITAQKILVNSLSAISAYLGTITSAIIDMASGTGWQYIRTQSKWLFNSVNGWIFGANPATGDYFSEFRAGSGDAMVLERKAYGPNVSDGNPIYYLLIRDAAGNVKICMDNEAEEYVFDGHVVMRSGEVKAGVSVKGHLEGATGSFDGNLSAAAINAVSRINIGDEQIVIPRAVDGTSITFAPSSMVTGESIKCVITAGFNVKGKDPWASSIYVGGEAQETRYGFAFGGTKGVATIYVDGVPVKSAPYFVRGAGTITPTLTVPVVIQKGAVVSIGFAGEAFTSDGTAVGTSTLSVGAGDSYLATGWILVQGGAK